VFSRSDVYDVYKHLNLSNYGIDFDWFSDLIHSMIKNVQQHVMNYFVHPKYFSYCWTQYMSSYFDNRKRKKFVIDYFHEPEKVFEVFGPFHPLIYGECFTTQDYLAKQFYKIDNDYFVNLDDLLSASRRLMHFLERILTYPTKFDLNYIYVEEYDMFRFSFDFPCFNDFKQFASLYQRCANLYPRLVFTARLDAKYDSYCFSDGFFVYYVKQHPIEISLSDVNISYGNLRKIQDIFMLHKLDKYVYEDVLCFPFKNFYVIDKKQRRIFKVVTQDTKTIIQRVDFNLIACKLLETIV